MSPIGNGKVTIRDDRRRIGSDSGKTFDSFDVKSQISQCVMSCVLFLKESLNQYVQSINKIQSISSALLSSSKGGGIKEEQTISDSQLLEPEFLDKVEN